MNKKLLLITLIAASLIVVVIVILITNNKKKTSNYIVDPSQSESYCQQDSDCVWVYSECSGCECGKPVNKKYKTNYENQFEENCQDYSGPVCEFCCSYDLKCLNYTCVKSFVEGRCG